MKIDFGKAITAEDKATAAAAERVWALKAECKKRILAIGSQEAQMNITQAGVVFAAAVMDGTSRADALAAAGLQEGDLGKAQEWTAWITAMQEACRAAIDAGRDPGWPDVPAGALDLARRF